MPGVAGVFDPGVDAAEIERVLERMQRVMDVPSYPCDAHAAVGRGIGCLQLQIRDGTGPRPPIGADTAPHNWIVFDGELYNAAELRAGLALDERFQPGDTDARLCNALYAREGMSFVQRLNGQFNLVSWRGSERELTIATDRYGYRPLFAARVGSRLLFATEIKAIIAALERAPSIDAIGLLEPMLQGYATGNRTWLEPIQVIDPGTLLKVKAAGISQRRYFRLRFHHGSAPTSAAVYAQAMATKLARAVERMTPVNERTGVLLSGGLDSRSVLLAARRPLAAAFTFGDGHSRDVQYATALARRAHVPHLHLAYDCGYLGRVLSPVVWRTEGLLPFATVTFTSLHFHSRLGAHADALLYGHCGDVLTGAHLRPDVLIERSRPRMIDRLLHRQRPDQETVRRVLAPDFFRRHAPHLLDATRATFADIDHGELADVADVWDMENRQRRGTFHSPAVDRYRFQVRAPFLDNDLVDHLLHAPLRWRFEQVAYKQMIVGSFPHAADVPWAYTGQPIRSRLAEDLVDVARNYIGIRVRRWLGAPAPATVQFRDLAADLRADARIPAVLHAFVHSRWFPGDIFDRSGIEAVVRRHYDQGEDVTHTLVMLTTLATAFRLLLFERTDTMPAEAEPTA
jgi:asparagine synthetase B (glutamine-hydrolysing)